MRRYDAIQIISDVFSADALVVVNTGLPSRELYSIRDVPNHFYMLGSLGLVSSIGLGLAIAVPDRRVVVIDGDGSILMNLGSLATIASISPGNLLHFVLDNGCYGSTGGQPTATSQNTDLLRIGAGAGIKHVCLVNTCSELKEFCNISRNMNGCQLCVVKIDKENMEVPVIELEPVHIKTRFMTSIRSER